MILRSKWITSRSKFGRCQTITLTSVQKTNSDIASFRGRVVETFAPTGWQFFWRRFEMTYGFNLLGFWNPKRLLEPLRWNKQIDPESKQLPITLYKVPGERRPQESSFPNVRACCTVRCILGFAVIIESCRLSSVWDTLASHCTDIQGAMTTANAASFLQHVCRKETLLIRRKIFNSNAIFLIPLKIANAMRPF
jgi:hypothetical protein